MNVLKVQGLGKRYGNLQALEEVSFEVPAGSVFGILGPNGSGKTTLLGTVLEILFPSTGRFEWFAGKDLSGAQQRRRIGTLLETPNFYPYLTGAQNLSITASVRGCGVDGISQVLKRVGLAEHPKLPFGKYSLGMKQRLAIGGCLLGEPEVLIFDEPTNGLDPSGIADIRELIGQLHKEGKTMIVASHLLDQVEKVCTHVAILKKGRLLESGPMESVLRSEIAIDLKAADPRALHQALLEFSVELSIKEQDGGFRVSGDVTPEQLNRYCFDKGLTLTLLSPQKRDLESRFLEITHG